MGCGEEEKLELKDCETLSSGVLISLECPIADRCRWKDVEKDDEAECCWCCADRIYVTLKEEGYFVVRSGRANLVATPTCMKTKTGYEIGGLKVIVYSDPDSGIGHRDEVFITGFRFGVDDVLLNGQPLYTVHRDFGNEIRYCIGRLILGIRGESDRIGEDKERELIEQLKQIGEELGERIDERYFLGNTFMSDAPKRILVVSGRDACRGPIAKTVLTKILDEIGLYSVSVESAAYEKPESLMPEARNVIRGKYGKDLLRDHVPKAIDDIKVMYNGLKIIDHDLIIAMEEEYMQGLPEERTFTIKEIVGEEGSIREPKSLAECRDVVEEIERCLRAGVERIREMLYQS